MADPWLTIIGLGEDGLSGLPTASLDALSRAAVVFGGPRHLALADVGPRGQPWPVPFDISPVLACRGTPTVILASGDPFWHGAGGSLVAYLGVEEWRSLPAPSTPSLAANHLGWRLEDVTTMGLHAAPFSRLLPHLHKGAQIIATLRDGAAARGLADYLVSVGFGASTLHVMERLGGPAARVQTITAADFVANGHPTPNAPVLVAILAQGRGLPRSSGLPDDVFASDGQITKRPIRAITLSTLAPRVGEHLWDIGAGSGSISVEWCLAGGTAVALEAKPQRLTNIRANAETFGLTHRLTVLEGSAPSVMPATNPDAIFVGGGMDAALFARLQQVPGARLVVNSVTLETESLLVQLHAHHGGTLLRIDTAMATPLGRMHGWTPARPVVQWSVTL